jgi:hypothetical protein
VKKILFSFIPLIVLLIRHTSISFAQSIADDPLETKIEVANLSLKNGESAEATIILNNNSPYQISVNIEALKNNHLILNDMPQTQLTVAPYGTRQYTFEITGKNLGTAEVILLVEYTWIDSSTKQEHFITEALESDSIEITGFRFDWPSYIIPLMIGFVFGQLGTWLIDRRKNAKEEHARQEQTKGITLASLYMIQKGLERKETIAFTLWEEMVLKGNLYPDLMRMGAKIKEPKLAKRLTDVTVMISEYNNSRAQGSLSEDFVIDLTEEINQLIKIIEQPQ